LVAIENIKAGDKVIATNPETFEVAEKTVLETYVRETTELLHLTIGGEVIKTTFDHPFYVKDVGFVEAGKLQVGDRLVDSRGNALVLEGKKLEITDKPVKVYNFKVDDFHTYHVAHIGVLVHNASSNYSNGMPEIKKTKHGEKRAKERGFSDEKINDIKNNYSQKVYQSGGRTVFAKKEWHYYDVVIVNKEGVVITTVGGKTKSLKTWKDVLKMLKNNGEIVHCNRLRKSILVLK